jgi:hypothetical protein
MIRDARADDIPVLTDLIAGFYAEAPYEAPEINREKAAFILGYMIERVGDNVYVRVAEDALFGVVGVLIAERQSDLWSDAEKIVELIMYVEPAKRGSTLAGKLLLDFGKWCQIRPAVVRVEAGSGIDDAAVGSVFRKMGWAERGVLYGAEAY